MNNYILEEIKLGLFSRQSVERRPLFFESSEKASTETLLIDSSYNYRLPHTYDSFHRIISLPALSVTTSRVNVIYVN